MKKLIAIFLVLSSLSIYAQETEKDSVKSFQIIPFPNVAKNQVFGWGGGLNLAMLYKLNKKDTISPVNTTVIQPMYFQNNTWWVALYSEMYYKEDTWRTTFLGFHSNVNFQFYTQDYLPNFSSQVIAYTSTASSFNLTVLRRVFPKFYFGMQYTFKKSSVRFPNNEIIETLLDKFGYTDNTESGLGFSVSWDKRNDIYYPDRGFYWVANNSFYRKGIGSSVNYDFIQSEFSVFKRLGPKLIFASKIGMQITLGDVPFIDENIQGFGGLRAMDLRGYNRGEFRGEQMYNSQAEFRYNVYKRYSVNAYFGLGTVFTPGDGAPVLPATGLGLRYKASKKHNVNVGIDYAWGKNDSGIYFMIGEAF